MAENRFAHDDAREPEAATDEPASSLTLTNAPPAEGEDDLPWRTPAEEQAYYKGLIHGVRNAGREPGHPHMPAEFDLDLTRDAAAAPLVSAKLLEYAPPDDVFLPGTGRGTAQGAVEGPLPADVRQALVAPNRHDGFTPARRRLFLAALAGCGVVADACRITGVSRVTAYNLRNSAEGRAFAIGWDAAILLARRRFVDEVHSRAMCGVIERVYRNGELVAERHRYDNRLTMAVLTRLDRQADGLGEGAVPARAAAEEFDQFLDIVEAGGDEAGAFFAARANPPRDGEGDHAQHGGGGREAALRSQNPLHHAASRRRPPPRPGEDAMQSTAALLARLAAYKQFQAGLPHEIPTADLDPAAMADWTDEQWARAERSGFLDRLAPDQWLDAARTPQSSPGFPGEGDHLQGGGGAPSATPQPEEQEANGMCKVRKAWLDRHPPAAPPEEKDEFDVDEVWEAEGLWWTGFPPPDGFEGIEEGDLFEGEYRRELSDEELALILSDEAEERARWLAAEAGRRDRYFGFEGGLREEDLAPTGRPWDEGLPGEGEP